jgi:predicted transposase YdaD
LEAVFKGNLKIMEEVGKMSDIVLTMDSVLEELGVIARAESRIKAEIKAEIARNALDKGLSIEIVQDITGLDIETVRTLAGQ